MGESVEAIERRIGQLRAAVREAALAGDKARARSLRAQLREAEDAWEAALSGSGPGSGSGSASGSDDESEERTPRGGPPPAGPAPDSAPAPVPAPDSERSLLPLREQVYEALSLLRVPAAPRLIATVHEAFFGTAFGAQRMTSLRRDEERSFRASPFARPYYVCAALAADRLSPSRGLLAISTWPLEKRVIGSLSPRVDFLEAAIQVAEAIERIPVPVPAARRLLVRFAASIPGAATPGAGGASQLDPRAVTAAARAELNVHRDEDARTRAETARRARERLADAEQLFGAVLAGVQLPASDNSNKRAAGAPGAHT